MEGNKITGQTFSRGNTIKTKLTAKLEQQRAESNIVHLKEIISKISKELSDEAIKNNVKET